MELPHLQPLPLHPYDIATITQVRASPLFRIALDSNRYSVPAEYAGRLLTLKVYPDRLCVYDGQTLIARHVDQFLGHGARQADGAGQVRNHVDILAEHGFQKDVAHHHDGQAHLFEPLGRRRGHDMGCLHIHWRISDRAPLGRGIACSGLTPEKWRYSGRLRPP